MSATTVAAAWSEAPDCDADEDEPVEMVNLRKSRTGLSGTVYVSTTQGPHGPRVKWYPGSPARGAPCLSLTLEAEPRVINHGLPPREVAAAVPALRDWIALNRAALLEFWNVGVDWEPETLLAFADRLRRLP